MELMELPDLVPQGHAGSSTTDAIQSALASRRAAVRSLGVGLSPDGLDDFHLADGTDKPGHFDDNDTYLHPQSA